MWCLHEFQVVCTVRMCDVTDVLQRRYVVSPTRIMESEMSGRSLSSRVLRMGQPRPRNCIPSGVSCVQPERSRYTRRRQPLPPMMGCSPLLVKWEQWERLR